MKRQRNLVVHGVLAIVLGISALAWACTSSGGRISGSTPSGPSSSGGPHSGYPGSPFTVEGSDFQAGNVEIRWDSFGGPLMGTATGPSFSVNVQIPPDATSGVHYILAVQTTSPTTVAGQARMAFEVMNASGTTAGTSGEGLNADSAVGADGVTSGQTDGGTTGEGILESTVSGGSEASEAPNAASGRPSAAAVPAAQEQQSSPAGQPASTNSAVLTLPSGQTVFGGSVASNLQRTLSGDLYSGFGSSGGSLVPSVVDSQESTSGRGAALAFGMTALSAGLLALGGGFVAAERRRRRSQSRAS